MSYFNKRNLDEKTGFYKSNDFRNLIEYYINTYLIQALAKSKELKLPGTVESSIKARLNDESKKFEKGMVN